MNEYCSFQTSNTCLFSVSVVSFAGLEASQQQSIASSSQSEVDWSTSAYTAWEQIVSACKFALSEIETDEKTFDPSFPPLVSLVSCPFPSALQSYSPLHVLVGEVFASRVVTDSRIFLQFYSMEGESLELAKRPFDPMFFSAYQELKNFLNQTALLKNAASSSSSSSSSSSQPQQAPTVSLALRDNFKEVISRYLVRQNEAILTQYLRMLFVFCCCILLSIF